MTEDVSRRKMLSLLGLGAALGFTLSAAVEPLEAEAQTVAQAAPATPATRAKTEHTECNGGKDDAPIAVSGALVAMSDGTHAAPVSLRPPPRLRLNRGDPRPALTRRGSAIKQKGRGKPRLSSSLSLLTNNVSASESPRFAGGH